MVLHIIGIFLSGLLVGAMGRLVHPGRDRMGLHRMGLLMTMTIGVASVLIADCLSGSCWRS
jgi:uncharacterized membrane protein YeaQ/YmgE (transglycosylase-associated protein family)